MYSHNGFCVDKCEQIPPAAPKAPLIDRCAHQFQNHKLFRSTSFKVRGAFWQVKHKITRLNSALKVSE